MSQNIGSVKRAAGKNRYLQRILMLAGGSFVSIVIFAILLSYLESGELADAMKHIRISGLFWCLAAYLLMYTIRALRFQLIAPAAPLTTMVMVSALHTFFLRVIPARLGDLSYAYLVRKVGAADLGPSVLGLVLVRIIDIVVVVMIFGMTLATYPAVFQGNAHLSIGVSVTVGLAALLGVFFFGRVLGAAFVVWQWMVRLLHLDRYGVIRVFNRSSARVITDYLSNDLKPALLWGVFSFTVGNWIANFLVVFSAMFALNIPTTWSQAVLGGTGATVSGFLPLGAIGSFGPLEAGWALGFALVGFSQTQAVVSGLAYSLITFCFATVIGAVIWPFYWNKIRGYREASSG